MSDKSVASLKDETDGAFYGRIEILSGSYKLISANIHL